MTEEMLVDFNVPFVRVNGSYHINYLKCAYSLDGKAEMFMDIEQIKRGVLQNHMERCGARQVMIHTFPRNDTQNLAGKFLARVLEKADVPGIKSYQRGTTLLEPVADTSTDENIMYENLKQLQIYHDGLLSEEVWRVFDLYAA